MSHLIPTKESRATSLFVGHIIIRGPHHYSWTTSLFGATSLFVRHIIIHTGTDGAPYKSENVLYEECVLK